MARQIDPPTDQPDPTRAGRAARKITHIKVGARATLRGVAWRVGERSKSDLQRMMIAIFRANPHAFDGNINRLYRGAVLTIPSQAEVAAISEADAKREVHAQMAAWRTPTRAVAASGAIAETPAPAAWVPATPVPAATVLAATVLAATVPAALAAPPTAAISSNAIDKASDVPGAEALGRRVQSLEQELNEMKGLLESERDQLLEMRQQAVRADKPVPVAPQAISAPPAQPKPGYSPLVPIVAGLGILSTALAALYISLRRRRAPASKISHNDGAAGDAVAAADTVAIADAAGTSVNADGMADTAVISDGMADALLDVRRAAPQDPTVNLHVDEVRAKVDSTRLDYNFLDLDLAAQHVQMPSVLNEHAVVKERRTSLADVLKLALERDPERNDLRMKLLELYYSAAATNRTAFLEVVQKLARDRDVLQAEQWDKIAYMGRQIASDNPLFTQESADDQDLANCA
jgi:pilus assembly protein FimV